jgi:hypothetical protein
MPEREHKPHGDGTLSGLHQVAGDVIDSSDMICVHSVTQTKTIGEQRGAEERRELTESDDGPYPRPHVKEKQEKVDPENSAGKSGAHLTEQSFQVKSHGLSDRSFLVRR